ncbi:MAG TPA: carbohydrate-binding family 9-like protein [Kofleriaceae bacterium]|nr:carbohydrate-binding family 9-like protein [Kofleriaceae bacterium]
MRRTIVIAAVIMMAACVDKNAGQHQKQIDPGYVAANLLAAPPERLSNTVNADLDGKIVYLGNLVDGDTLVPGQKVTIKHYWKVEEAPGSEWRVFSHLRGEGKNPDFANVDATDMRTGHPPADWKKGEIIQDEQQFTLKSDWHSPTATLIVGLYPKGKHGVGDRMKIKSGPQLDGAVIAVKFNVDLSKGPPQPGTIKLRKAAGPITVDGKDNDSGWRGAVASGEFPTAEGSPDPSGKTVARMTYDDTALYLFISSDDTDVASQYKNQDDSLWKEDTVELFIDADGNRHGYVELQVNPNNAHFDTWWPNTRAQPDDKTYTAPMTSAVNMRGTLDNRDDTDQGWDVEIAIPWAAVKGKDEAMNVRLPPQPGDQWRMNVVRVDKGKDASIAAASWNKITYQDFHALDRMLTVVFADANGGTTPPPMVDAGVPSATLPDGGAGAGGPGGNDKNAPAIDAGMAIQPAHPTRPQGPIRATPVVPKPSGPAAPPP